MKQQHNLKVNIPQKDSYSYDILIGENLLENLQTIISSYTKANKFLVVTNETIYALYKGKFVLDNAEFVILPDGEEFKDSENLKKIIDATVEAKLERKDCIIAFGGGVIGDMAGYAAASYMRGVDFIQIPTTLLAMVDSSVGGKVAINHEHGKNLIGAFYQPKLVLADISLLKTLPLRQLKTGLAEVLKYAFIEKTCGAKEFFNLFEFLSANKDKIHELDCEILSKLINICCELKAAVVNQDETEKGLRAILNLGHTFAHSIENLTNYVVYTHGEAVALGLKMAFKLAFSKNLIDNKYYKASCKLVDDYEIIPEFCELNKEDLYNEMFLDKKAQDGNVRFVLPSGEYSVGIYKDIEKELVIDAMS